MSEPTQDDTPRRTVHLVTFGCQMNRADSAALRGRLREAGYRAVDDPARADLIVYNTCAVRESAEDRVHGRIASHKRDKERHPDLVLAVIGCMAQRLGAALRERHPHLDLVVGPDQFGRLPELVEEARHRPRVAVERRTFDELGWEGEAGAVNAFVPVMRGCDNRCTYCIVPSTRGPERSRRPEAIEDDVRRAIDAGHPQITLLGQTVDGYGRDLDADVDLARLLRRLHGLPGLARLRFVTSHPRYLDDELLAAVAELPRVAKHLHAPPQSGSSRILRRMGRRYTRADYDRLLERAHARIPDLDVQADFIVGFPGETAEDFRASVDLVERARFCGAFVFMYSPRPGTPAARMADDVPAELKRERCNELLARQLALQEAEHRDFHGRTLQVLLEGPSKSDPERLQGRSEGHRNVIVPRRDPTGASRDGSIGRIVPVRIERSTNLTLFGDVLDAWAPGPDPS